MAEIRDFQRPGRSTVHAAEGMAATSHPASTLVAIEVLRAGGNAVDAAIAASAVQAVVEPHSTGIGGDCFALYAPGGGNRIVALNGSGRAPQAVALEWFRDNGIDRIALDSPHAVTVPGAVDAWATLLADYGTMSLADILSPAIRYAADGYVVHPRSARDWARNVEKLSGDETATRIFLPGGRPPEPGDIIRQPELAETLRAIASEGRDGFYTGDVAADIVDFLHSIGGFHSLDDFAAHASDYVTPIRSTYRGYDVYECPPNGQGIAVLIMLGILEGFDLADHEPLGVERLHLEAEATRLAYWICEENVGDPETNDIPVDEMLSADNFTRLRERIHIDRIAADIPVTKPVHPETIYLTVVDKDRNAISLINSVCFAFGSGRVSPKTGVLLQNRGASFMIDPDHPNSIGPGKRPRHTIIPGLAVKDGRTVLPFGVMGGQFQPVGQVHVLTNIVDYGMDVQQALDLARGFHFGGVYSLERGIDDDAAAGLLDLGHEVARAESPLGSGQAIWIDWEKGTLIGGSDPRKDGMALGY